MFLQYSAFKIHLYISKFTDVQIQVNTSVNYPGTKLLNQFRMNSDFKKNLHSQLCERCVSKSLINSNSTLLYYLYYTNILNSRLTLHTAGRLKIKIVYKIIPYTVMQQ